MDDAGVMDVGLETGIETPDTGTSVETEQQDPKAAANKFSQEYRNWVRQMRDTQAKENPAVLKYAKTAYDSYGRMEALRQLDPKGIDGVRETYSLIQAAGGPQAITEMQQKLSERENQDALLAAGDPKAFDALGEDFAEGLAKLAPAYLDRLMKTSPEQYTAALLPHLMTSLTKSELVTTLDAMIEDIQNGGYDDKAKIQRLSQHLVKASQWFNQQNQRAGQLKQAPAANPDLEKFQTERTEFEKQKDEHFWNTQVTPDLARHENTTFENLLKPYLAKSPQLGDPKVKAKMLADFKSGLNAAGKADADYMRQMGLYQTSKQRDPNAIKTYVRNAITAKASTVFQEVLNDRYGPFLNGKPGPKPGGQRPVNGAAGPSAPTIVMSKPNPDDVDWNKTKRANGGQDMYNRIYTLKSGKRVQVRK